MWSHTMLTQSVSVTSAVELMSVLALPPAYLSVVERSRQLGFTRNPLPPKREGHHEIFRAHPTYPRGFDATHMILDSEM